MHGAIAGDHRLGGYVDPHDPRRQPPSQGVPCQALVPGIVAHEAQRLLAGIADDHRDRPTHRRCIGIEGVTWQAAEIEHRPEVEAAEAQDRILGGLRLQQPFHRHRRRLGCAIRRQAQRFQPRRRPRRGVDWPGGRDLLTAHGRGAVEQTLGGRHGHQGGDLGAASRLAEQHDPQGIAPERRDIVPHPLQSQDQVQLPGIAGILEPRRQPREIGVSEHVQAMIQGDHHDIPPRRQSCAVIERVRSRARRIGAPVDIDHHWATRCVGPWSPDIQEETILALVRLVSALGTGCSVSPGADRIPPRLRSPRRSEALRGRPVSQTLEYAHAIVPNPNDGTGGGLHPRIVRTCADGKGEGRGCHPKHERFATCDHRYGSRHDDARNVWFEGDGDVNSTLTDIFVSIAGAGRQGLCPAADLGQITNGPSAQPRSCHTPPSVAKHL